VDEADSFLKLNEELRGIINSGHTRSGAQVLRCAEPNFEPRAFSTWCPKVIALIGRLPSTIEDRSLIVPLSGSARMKWSNACAVIACSTSWSRCVERPRVGRRITVNG
jgi:hypothetical protein